ncbi:hypothetical protein SVIOM342S_00520 [Streptomyces violaceorubidus]
MTGNIFQVARYAPDKAGWAHLSARDSLARRLDWPTAGRRRPLPDRLALV